MATINFTKQNFNFIPPYSKQGVVYDSRNIFVFKGGTANTLNTIFPFPSDFIAYTNSSRADSLRVSSPNTFLFNRAYYRYSTTNGLWRLNPSTGDAGSTILDPGTLIYYRQGDISTQNIRGARLAPEAMVQRYYQGNTIINNKYLSTLPTSRVSSGPIQGSYIYRQQRTLPSGIDIYPTGDNGRTTYQIKYQGPVNTQLIDILDPSLLFTADPDAQSYFNRANITDPIAKINISEFCLGLKNLNLWNNTLNIYLLNSGYNSTVGTTVYGLKTGYDGNLINSSQATWTSSGIFLRSGYAGNFPNESSGKAAIGHPILPVFTGNFSIAMLGKTTHDTYGAWWMQTDRAGWDRSIWLQPNAYYYSNEFAYGNIITGSIGYAGNPRLNTANQYNVISYDVNFKYTNINQYTGSGSLTIYKDGIVQVITTSGNVSLPNFCVRGYQEYYPCDQHSGFIGGIIDLTPDGNSIGTKSQGYYSFAGAFSRVLSSGEHLGLKNLILNTIAQNISLN